MQLNKNTKLSDLMYGHGDKFIPLLSGKFHPEKYPRAPAIQVCELKCGCWIVADGNNRVGLILKASPDATVADIPTNLLFIEEFGTWDVEMMEWWNPSPKSFKVAMSNQTKREGKKTLSDKSVVHGMIEKVAERKFFAISHVAGIGATLSATGRSVDEAKKILEEKIKRKLKRKKVSLVLSAINQLESHECHGNV